MTLLDRLLQHDAWTTHRLLACSAGLADAQLDHDFDLGLRTLRATFDHVIRNVELWTDLMTGAPVRERGGQSIPELIIRLDQAASEFAGLAREIDRAGSWDERWTDPLDDPPTQKTYGGAITHVITHSMHHRAQLLFMLRRLGVEELPEGDVLSWEQQASGEAEQEQQG